ncbi:MAG TPA: hypothetical protein VEA69_23100, partial [Tepidisphaeraceae bacterium]|nr:hypothetical protein [Tepidisphaeraceae bacterium]
MSHVPDMDMQSFEPGTVSVGWLHPDHPFPQADVAPEFLAKLKEYADRCPASAAALGLGAAGGYHTCEFCERAHGTANFGVPDGDRLFFSPEMIAHYVEAHRYAPPAEFVAAVMASPLPGTREYVDAVAPFLARERASHMLDPVAVTLERHVALVLFEFLSRVSEADEFWNEERADQVATWTLVSSLKSILFEPFDPRYPALLERARR